ncbi:MAG: glycosyltransferase [Dehalococcoidia bacterium]|nr:glycosyltransferase [Dehalococcoidia bacterium]
MEVPVGIVCVNFNGGAYLEEFLRSLDRVTRPSWRLVLVDNASWDGSGGMARAVLGERATVLSRHDNLGYAAGVNAGVRHCIEQGYEQVVLINPDTVVRPDFLYYLVQAAEPTTLVTPKVLLYGTTRLDDTVGTFDWERGIWRDWIFRKPESHILQARQTVDMASMCCMLAPTSVFASAGFLDESYFMYYEDFDFVHRAQAAGYEVVLEPRSVIEHRKSAASGGGSPFFTYYTTRNRMHLVRQHVKNSRQFALFLAYFLPGRVIKTLPLLLRLDTARVRAMWAGVADYFKGVTGPSRYLPHPRE